jgi:UDP-galactopyranose mutase
MKHDILIIGAGISGATLAERFANVSNKKVLVIEKRDHVGGNCYDFYTEDGLLVPKYGPHFFHTNYEDVWKYVNRFSKWRPYEHRVLCNVDGKTHVPVNITTVNTIFGLHIQTEAEMKSWLAANTDRIENPKNSEEAALRRVGRVLYEKIFRNYTKKQWDIRASELGAEVMDRIPVRTTFDDRYFSDTYQAMPAEGYTKIFEKMLDHPNITVRLNEDFVPMRESLEGYEAVFFTGRIDAFFGRIFGRALQYRSLRFEFESLDMEYFQSRAQINFPNTELFTRITEPKHATGQKHRKTVIIKEYGTSEGEPYYPVPSKNNKDLYEKYRKEAEKLESKNIYFVGRLAEYKYMNMDQAFKNSLNVFDRFNLRKENASASAGKSEDLAWGAVLAN